MPTLGITNPNAQVDLRQAWLDTERGIGAPPTTGCTSHGSVTTTPAAASSPTSSCRNPAPASCAYDTATEAAAASPAATRGRNRRAGDFMILWDQQGGSMDLLPPHLVAAPRPNLMLSPPTLLNAAVSQAAYSADGFRGEAAVDLTATDLRRIHRVPVVRQHHPEHRDRQLRHRGLQGHDPADGTADQQLHDDDGDHTEGRRRSRHSRPGGISIGTGVVAVKDSAVVSLHGRHRHSGWIGGVLPLQGGRTRHCATSRWARRVGSTNVTGTAYPVTVVSPTAYVTSVGRYCWRAVYDAATRPTASRGRATRVRRSASP